MLGFVLCSTICYYDVMLGGEMRLYYYTHVTFAPPSLSRLWFCGGDDGGRRQSSPVLHMLIFFALILYIVVQRDFYVA